MRARLTRPRAAGACLALAVAALSITSLEKPGSADASAPVFWSLNLAEVAVQDAYATGAECVPVGPKAMNGKTAQYGEFACSVFLGDGGQRVLAIEPASSTQLVYRKLNGTVSPAPLSGSPGFVQQAIIIDQARGLIELEDQSIWQIPQSNRSFSSWKPGDRMSVVQGKPFAVDDLTRTQRLPARFLGFDT